MNEKLVSVIVPVFNAQMHLNQCIDSILKQSHRAVELILIDDGSTDNSGNICRQYQDADSRVKYYRVSNGGPLKARAYGIELCHGEWVAFCDSDDYYPNNNCIKQAVRYAEKYCCDVLQYGVLKKYHHLKKKTNTVKEQAVVDRDEFIQRDYPKLLCSQWPGSRLSTSVWNKLYSRKMIENCPEHDTLPWCFWGDDLILNLFLLADCRRIVFSPECMYTYRYGGGTNAWKQSAMKDLNTIKSFQKSFLSDWKGENAAEIQNRMYAEIAAWFFLHVQSGLKTVSEADMRSIICRTLELPMFQEARQYYLEENTDKWDAVRLLRNADPDAYILEAKKAMQNQEAKSVKSAVKSKIVKLMKSI